MEVFFVKSKENAYPKGRTLVKMYRVVPVTKKNLRSECQRVLFLYPQQTKLGGEELYRI